MQKIAIETKYGWTTARFGRYSNGHLGIQLFLDGGESLAKISTNLLETSKRTYRDCRGVKTPLFFATFF